MDHGQQVLRVELVDRRLTISVGVDTLAEAVQISDYGEDCKVTDIDGFAKDVLYELKREEEDGTTLVHRLFDNAAGEAVEQGSEHVSGFAE